MAKRHPLQRLLKDAERASKRQHFDPATEPKPKRPWLDLEVGQSFDVPRDEIKYQSLAVAAWTWSQKTGRVFSVSRTSTHWIATRTA